VIEDNLFRASSPLPLLSIYSVDGLTFVGNRLEKTRDYPAPEAKAGKLFMIADSDHVKVEEPKAAPEPVRPNILIMLADDLGYADLGVQGCTDVPTPHIDSIAKSGVRFTSGYVSAPVCSPCRAGLMTGRYQTRFGHELNHPLADNAPMGMPVDQKTAADWMKQAGYVTGHIGKWHLGNPKLPQYSPTARGFDESVWFPGQGKLPPLTLYRNGKAEKANERYVDEAMAREAGAFIIRHAARPWFLYVAFLTPHEPLDTPAEVEAEFSHITDPARRKCAAMLSLLDKSVGRVLQALRDSGQENRTLVVFFSDNGAPPKNGSRNTPLRGGKGSTWEGGIREPFIMQWKGTLPAGRVVDAPVISLDLLRTSLAAARVEVPADSPLDGANLLPYLTGQTQQVPHEVLFWRYGTQMAVRAGDWKLIKALDRNERPPTLKTGLYQVAKDAGEQNDLAAQHPEKVQELQKLWNDWNKKNVEPLWSDKVSANPPNKGSAESQIPTKQ
jgi:arylsulfatase A-like enzyme